MKHLVLSAVAFLLAVSCGVANVSEVGKRAVALDDSAWDSSVWISAKDAPVVTGTVVDGTRSADGSSWFTSVVTNEKKVVSAKWMTTGLGVYELYLNGKIVGEEVLKPGFTHYAKTKRSFTYDVTDMFMKKKGAKNLLAAQMTPGWWADKIITPRQHQGMIGEKCAFRAVLELTFADGTKALYGTDCEHWLAGVAGPVKHASIFDGEEYDAREALGFDTPEKLDFPEQNDTFKGEILPSAGAEIYFRHDKALRPVRAYVWEGVENANDHEYGKVVIKREYAAGKPMKLSAGETLVVDFGQNSAAVPSFTFSAEEGTVLTCLPSELMNDGNGSKARGMDGPEGSTHRLNLRVPDTGMRITYTFASSKTPVSYTPRYTFFGYRLVSITATADVTIEKIESIPVSSITGELETGRISTGNELINKLISNTYWGQISNYLSVPTDCPQRNERLGWTADTQVYAEAGSFFANTDAFFHKWMRDMRDSQSPRGGFPGVAPKAQYGAEESNMMRVGWADAGVIVPWTIWKQFADTQIVDESWDSMEKFMDHMAEVKYDHNALAKENGNYQWGDWLSYEPLESSGGLAFMKDAKGKKVPRPEAVEYWNYLLASYWVIDSEMMCQMAAATGRDAAKYRAMAEEARQYIRDNFIDDKGEFKLQILNTMQTPALFALKNNILDGEAKEALKARLRENFAQHDNCLQTGFLGTSILMETLTESGMEDIAYELLFQRKNPSWLYSVDNGATTIWERWNSYTIEEGMGLRSMNSFNHYAYGAVCAWIWKTAAGIASDPAEPGFKHIIMAPIPDRRLGHLDAEFNSAAGLIKSSWKYDGDAWNWFFTIPEGAHATVILPGEKEPKEYTSGSYNITKNL